MTTETDLALQGFLKALTELVKLACVAVKKEIENDGK